MSTDPLADATGLHEFFWFWYEWVRSPARRRQIDDLTGLPESAWKILVKLRSAGPMSVTDIGRVVDLDKSTVSRHLEPLRVAQLIVETPGSHNRRVLGGLGERARGGAVRPRRRRARAVLVRRARAPAGCRAPRARALLGRLQVAMEQEPEMRVSRSG